MSAIAVIQDPAPVPSKKTEQTEQPDAPQTAAPRTADPNITGQEVPGAQSDAPRGRSRNLIRTARRHVSVVHADAVASSQCLERQARRWSTFRNGTAPLVALTAATAGFAGLSGLVGHEAAGLIALGSAALSGTLTALNPVKRAQSLEKKAQRWDALADATQRCLDFELLLDGPDPGVHDLEQTVKGFEECAGKIGENHRPSHKPARPGRRTPVRASRPAALSHV
jgi:hypothetical protein